MTCASMTHFYNFEQITSYSLNKLKLDYKLFEL